MFHSFLDSLLETSYVGVWSLHEANRNHRFERTG